MVNKVVYNALSLVHATKWIRYRALFTTF